MVRFTILLVLACLVFRWALGQWPWEMLTMPRKQTQSLAQARKWLDLEPDASRDQILAAHKRVLAKVHPDRGGTSEAVHKTNEARDLLLNALPPKAPRS